MCDLAAILEQFGVVDASYESLADSENANHRVTTATGERYLLRQHRSDGRSLTALESELIWLTHLHERGLEVQRPAPLRSGAFVLLDDSRRFSLLTWIEGEVMETIDEVQAARVGALMARLHLIADDFNPPPSFERPHYDAQFLTETLATLRGIAWLEGDWALLERAVLKAQPAFELPQQTVIHADLHPGNLIWRGDEVMAIDFDRCGLGPLGFDMMSALGYLEADACDAFLHGYQQVRALPAGFEAQRHLYTIAEWLTNLAFLAPRPQEREFVDTVMLPGLRQQLPALLER
jgi:Ser/Thr protein kinase RdoA (MazF antagonist)